MAAPGRIDSRPARAGYAVALASGGYLMIMGAVFLAPFLMDPRAQQNDVFLTNLFIGPLFLAAGSALFWGSMASLGVGMLALVVSWLANLLLVAAATWAASAIGADSIPAWAALTALDVLFLVAASSAVFWRPGHLSIWVEGLLVAAAMASAATLCYFALGGRYLAAGEVASNLPPYLNLTVIMLSVLLAAGSAITARMFIRR